MARYVDLEIPSQQAAGDFMPAARCRVMLDNDGQWHVQRPLPANFRYYFGGFPGGRWSWNRALHWISLYAMDNSTLLFELRGVNAGQGPAFGRPNGNRFDIEARWQASAVALPNTWLGLMTKGSVGAVLGTEMGAAALVSMTTRTGVGLGVASGRAGLVAGGSAGVAFVIATGFASPKEFEGFSSSGMDWALSIGLKASGFLKSSRLAGLMAAMHRFEGGLDAVEGVLRARVKDTDLIGELHSAAKNVLSGGLVDTSYKGVAAFDLPFLGAGAEAGIYMAWSKFKLLSQWTY